MEIDFNNDIHVLVASGLKPGDKVAMNPRAFRDLMDLPEDVRALEEQANENRDGKKAADSKDKKGEYGEGKGDFSKGTYGQGKGDSKWKGKKSSGGDYQKENSEKYGVGKSDSRKPDSDKSESGNDRSDQDDTYNSDADKSDSGTDNTAKNDKN